MNDQALAVRTETAISTERYSLEELTQRADAIVKAGLAPNKMTAAELVVTMLRGQELGVQPLEAVDSIYVVNGKAAQMTHLLVAQLKAAGHGYKIMERTDTTCTIQFYNANGEDPLPHSLTRQECDEAGWTKDTNGTKWTWAKMPKIMLQYRTLSTGIMANFPEVKHSSVGVETNRNAVETIPNDFEQVVRQYIQEYGEEATLAYVQQIANAIREEDKGTAKSCQMVWSQILIEQFRKWLEGAGLTEDEAKEMAAAHYGLDEVKLFKDLPSANITELEQAISSELHKRQTVDAEVTELDGVGDENGREQLQF